MVAREPTVGERMGSRGGAAEVLPWPNLRGKRCLYVAQGAGALADEPPRRGAAETIHVDLPPAAELDATTLGAFVRGDVGAFDVVVCEDVLTRQRDPLGALGALHRVTAGMLLSTEPIDLWPSILGRGAPRLSLHASSPDATGCWFSFNGAGHRRLLQAAGFAVERISKPFAVGDDDEREADDSWRKRVDAMAMRLVTRDPKPGVLHRALLARVVL